MPRIVSAIASSFKGTYLFLKMTIIFIFRRSFSIFSLLYLLAHSVVRLASCASGLTFFFNNFPGGLNTRDAMSILGSFNFSKSLILSTSKRLTHLFLTGYFST